MIPVLNMVLEKFVNKRREIGIFQIDAHADYMVSSIITKFVNRKINIVNQIID